MSYFNTNHNTNTNAALDTLHYRWHHRAARSYLDCSYSIDRIHYDRVIHTSQVANLEAYWDEMVTPSLYNTSEPPRYWDITWCGILFDTIDRWLMRKPWLPTYDYYTECKRERCMDYLLRAHSILERYHR